MKATQDNASWISNTYQQGSAEDNWAKMGVSYQVPRKQQVVRSATTTSVEIDAPDGGYGSTKALIVSNSTDGDTAVTATVTNNSFSAPSSFGWSSGGSTNYWDSSNSGITSNDQLRSALMTPDGTTLYRKYYAGATWYKFTLGTNYQPQAGANTYVSSFNLNTTVGTRLTTSALASQKITYAAGGNYAFMFGYGFNVARLTLATPYLLETVSSTTVWDIESTITGYDYNYSSSDDNLLFTNIKISSDGTKGIYGIRIAGTTSGDSSIPNLQYGSFTLSTPFDLSTMTINATSNLGQGNNGNSFSPFCEISENGEYVYTQGGEYNGSAFYLRIRSLNTAWDVSSYNNLLNLYTSSSNFYNGSMMYNRNNNGSFVIDNTNNKAVAYLQGNDFYVDNSWTGRWYPTTTLDITSASLTAAPTSVIEDNSETVDVSYLQLTRAAADKEEIPLAISKQSTGTSLHVFPPMGYQGSTALNSQLLSIDGTGFTTSTATHSDNTLSFPANPVTTSNNPNTKGSNIETYGTFVGLFQYDDPSARPANSPQYYYHAMGMQFNNDGTKFFVSGYADNPNFSAFGGPSSAGDDVIVEWDLSTPWDISTKSYANVYRGDQLKGAPTEPSTNYECLDFQFKDDGTKMYVMHNSSGNGYIYEGTLSTPYDISTWSYSHHIKLFGSDGVLDEDYTYSFGISEDGMAMKVFRSNTTGDISSESNTKSNLIKFGTAWNLASVSNGGGWSSYRAYRGCLTGDSSYGYACYNAQRYISSFSGQNMSTATLSGDRSDKGDNADQTIILSSVENYSTTTSAPGKTIIVDGGTKMYIHFPLLHSVMMFTGPFGNFQDKYTIDISSLSLTEQPKDVRFGTNSTYTSLPSGSVTTTANLYKEYSISDTVIDAEALRFKIEGDTDAEVTRFNVDLST